MDCLMTFSEEIRRKRIFIWEINSNSAETFAMIAFRKIEVEAFVTQHMEYVGEHFFNIPIISDSDIEKDADNGILIVPDGYDIEQIEVSGMGKCYYSQALSLNEKINSASTNYLYGVGKRGKEYLESLELMNVTIDGFCVTSKADDSYMERNVLQFDELTDKSVNIIIAVYDRELCFELAEKCYRAGINNVFVEDIIDKNELSYNMLPQLLDNALKNNKKIMLYTKELNCIAKHIIDVLNIYGIRVEKCIYAEERTNEISSVFDLIYQGIEDCFVLINEYDGFETQKACDLLDTIGFSLEEHNYTGIKRTTIDYIGEKTKELDPLVGHSMVFEKYTGIKVHGTEEDDSTKILILGGSNTADGVFRPLSWPEILWNKFRENGKKVTIYNMAHSGDDCTRELLRLIRDGWYLKPDICISMSGANSTYYTTHNHRGGLEHVDRWAASLYPDTELFGGISKEESLYDYWYRIEQLIRMTSNSIGAEFLCYLQPIIMLKEKKTLYEYYCHDDLTRHNENSFCESAGKDDFYINLLTLFDNKNGMYIDKAHYTQKANTILADIVYQDVVKILERKNQ